MSIGVELKMIKFNLRQLFFFLTLVAFILFLIRPFIVFVLDGVDREAVGVFLNTYRHIGYLFDIKTEYVHSNRVKLIDGFAFTVGFISSILLHVVFFMAFVYYAKVVFNKYCK